MGRNEMILRLAAILIIGEGVFGAVSRPISALGNLLPRKKSCDVERVAGLITVINRRICKLEEKLEEEA